VSDVVATILLLALTVTLFASIFAFVTSFPAPPAQNSNQFQATLIYNSGSTAIIGLNIVHLAGPQVSTSAQIYLKSAGHPCVSACPFVGSVPVSLGITTPYWNLGQTWTALFTSFPGSSSYPGDPVPDNVTVSIVTDANLIFSVILPGQAISVPATITATWITPGTPTVGTAYEVFATVAGTLGTNPVYLTGVPGEATGPQQMTYSSTSGYWYYNVPSGGPSAGTFVGFVSATSSNGASATAPVTVVISANSGGQPLSVGVVLSTTPPAAGVSETVQGIVTYSGPLQNAALTVSFYANTTGGTPLWTSTGPSGLTISGPSTETVFSQTAWTIPTGPQSYVVQVSATVAGFGPARGALAFTVRPVVSVSPSQGPTGATATVSGTGFTTSSTVTMKFGTTTISACTSGSLSTSGTGTFSCAFAVPSGYAGTTPTITVTDVSSGVPGTTTFTVTTPALTLNPTSGGTSGNSVTATGSGFTPGVSVTFTINHAGTITLTGSCTVSGTGTFSCTVTISGSANTYTVTATGSDGSFDSATASFRT
jgi:hypothetical protein